MRILVIGGTGTIGSALVRNLRDRHEVIVASRNGEKSVDLEDAASVRALLRSVGPIDAVVTTAGTGTFKKLEELTDADIEVGLRNKLMGQINVARAAIEHLRDGGSITMTSGILSRKPEPGSSALALANGGLEGFAKAAALDLPRGIRINVVSPPWVKETLAKLGMPADRGLSADDVAKGYVRAIEGTENGATIEL